MQLRELALLNGTLRENDGPRCSNCGAADHKSWMVSIINSNSNTLPIYILNYHCIADLYSV